jgi:CPA1 family monovalent cation:H+ antiporter
VVAGLIIGHHGRRLAMSEQTRYHLDLFWHLVDEILNAVLFVLIGLEVLVMNFQPHYLWSVFTSVPLVLAARGVSVGLPYVLLRRHSVYSAGFLKIMIWAGLRGGLSVAMALSLPAGPIRNLLVAVTYGVVVFGFLVQGTTLTRLIAKPSSPGNSSNA